MGPDILYAQLFPGEPTHFQWFCRSITEEIKSHSPSKGRMLDLGCGDNARLEKYRTRRRQVWGADFQAHPQLAHKQWFRLLGPKGEIPFPANHFDVVVAVWVLEHVAQPGRFLREIQRVLVPGGMFLAHSISATHYVTWLSRLCHLLPHDIVQGLVRRLYGRPEHDTFPACYRLNTEPRVKSYGQRAGLNLVRFQRFAEPGNYFRFSTGLRRLAVRCDWLLEKFQPGWGRIYFSAFLEKPRQADFRLQIADCRIEESHRVGMPLQISS